jgi:hypothetical protein
MTKLLDCDETKGRVSEEAPLHGMVAMSPREKSSFSAARID